MKKVLAGLTGLTCSGKNYIGSLLEKRGISVLDLDAAAHRVLEEEEVKTLVTGRWGQDLLEGGGKINRKLLGERVFGRPEELRALEGIIHPAVDRDAGAWIEENPGPVLVINGAVLHKAMIFERFDFLIVVRASILTRFIRARGRDRLKAGQIIRRFQRQADFPDYRAGGRSGRGISGAAGGKFFMGKADNSIISIYNEGAGFFSRFFRKKLEKQVDNLMKTLEKAAK